MPSTILLLAQNATALQPDTALLRQLRDNPNYDYSHEAVHQDISLWDALWDKVVNMLDDLIDSTSFGNADTPWLVIMIATIIIVIAVILYKHPEWFDVKKQVKGKGTDDDLNIYGVNFDAEIAKARRRGDWRRVVRIIYLQTLRRLADGGQVNWRPSKTPTQYTFEVTSDEFREMTNIFLRVRYGDFPANQSMADQMVALQAVVTPKKPVGATENVAEDAQPKEKGGSNED